MAIKIKKMVDLLEPLIKNPKKGLPEDVFLFASRITPMVSVDLLVKSADGRTLLTWRRDVYYGPGWHIPGGIIRYKEKLSDRINAVAKNELGAKVRFKKEPLVINEFIVSRKNRGHFISFLYECILTAPPDKNLEFKKGVPKPGQWAWRNGCPEDLIAVQKIYKKFI